MKLTMIISKNHFTSIFGGAILFSLIFMGVFLLLGRDSSALSGAGDYFPNTSPGSQGRSYAIVQVTGSAVRNSSGNLNANTKMKARTTIANIYVPKSRVGQLVTINIVNGCDGTVRDNDSSAGHTQFRIRNSTISGPSATLDTAVTNSSLWCLDGSDMQMTFIATALNTTSPNYARAYTYDNGTEYNVYQFIAHGNMIESGSDKRYLNAFGLAPITSGLSVGISGYPEGCDDFSYRISCPTRRTINRVRDSWVYSSFYGPSPSSILANYDQSIYINSTCAVSTGGISFYDFDASDASLNNQTNLEIRLFREGVALSVNTPSGSIDSIPKAGIQNWGPGILGLLSPHPGFGGNNDQYMDIPGGDPMFTGLGTFSPGVNYELQINNIDSDNAIQILPTFPFCPPPESPQPVGYIDSCVMSGRNVILYGWAYDNDGTTSAEPQVSLNVTGQAGQTRNSDLDYRSGDINSFLNSNNYGNKAQDNRYGFTATYSGMTKGNTYSVSGTITNVGTGSDQALGINAPAFPSNNIPDACLPPQAEPPTCNASGGRYYIGVSSKLTTASASNVNTSGAMTITSARYVIVNGAGTQIASGSDSSDVNIPAKSGATNGTKGYDGENHTINTAGAYQARWTFDWNINGVSGTITCASPGVVPPCTPGDTTCPQQPCTNGDPGCPVVPHCFEGNPDCPTPPPPDPPCGSNPLIPEVCYQAPTCGAAPPVIGNVGAVFDATATINNPNPVALPVDSVTYIISGAYIGPQNRIGPVSGPNDITTSSNKVYNFSDDVAKDRPTMIQGQASNFHTVTWTVVSRGGTITCGSTITIVVMPPICVAEPASFGVDEPFGPQVNVDNPNNAVNMKMNAISYSINPGNYTGSVADADRTDAPPGNRTYTASDTSIPNAGEYTTTWTVFWEVTPMSQTFDCSRLDNDTLISNQPYARFYGNDIFAGGGFGDSCTTAGLYDALGFGRNSTHDTYLGTASELAVFAVGQIQNVLPGSQRSRGSPHELGFANTLASRVDASTGRFGGGFGSVMCSPDYYLNASSAVKLAGANSDLSSLSSGSYLYGDGAGTTTVLTTGTGIADGSRVVVYVDGNVRITDSAGRFGFTNVAGNWPSFSDIPSLYIIASGNVYIDNDVTTMDGVYVAQPRSGSLTTGQIYSCSRNATDPLTNLSSRLPGGNAEFILSSCSSRLTVNGSFIAKKVHLLRSLSTVSGSKPYDTYKDPTNNIAEVFRFTPELYLIEGGGLPPRSTNAKIDSIIALPPAF